MILQLSMTFLFQISFFKYEIKKTEVSLAWDMFGFLLSSLKTYQVKILAYLILIGFITLGHYVLQHLSHLAV